MATVRTEIAFGTTLALIALSAVVAALAARFGHSLTVDEPFTANSTRLPWRELFDVFRVDNIPLAYVAFKTWTAVFGESEFALRSLPALAYGGTVVLVGLAGRRASDAAAGLTAAALLAASDRIGLAHAATARPYALLALVTSAAMLQSVGLLPVADGEVSRRSFGPARLWLTHLAGLFIHPTYVVIAAACAAASLATRRVRSALFVAPVMAVVTYLVVWGIMVRQTMALGTTSWMKAPTLADVKLAYMWLWGAWPGFMLAGAVVALALRRPSSIVEAFSRPARLWILAATLVAWALAVVGSLWKPIFEPTRTPMMLLPFTAVLVAFVLRELGGRLVAIILALVFVAAAGHRVTASFGRDPVPTRASVATLLQQVECGATLIAAGLARESIEYYLRQLHAPNCLRYLRFPADIVNWTGRMQRPEIGRELEHEATALADSLTSTPRRVWLVMPTRGPTFEAGTIIETALRVRRSCGAATLLRGAFFNALVRCDPVASINPRESQRQIREPDSSR